MNLNDLIAQAEAAGQDFKPVRIPEGLKVRAEITHMNYKVTRAGNPGFGVRTKILEGEHAGVAFWTTFFLNPKQRNGEPNNAGIAIFFRNLDALGFSPDEFKAGMTIEAAVNTGRGLNKQVIVETEDNEFHDVITTRAKNLKKVPASQAAPGAAPVVPPLQTEATSTTPSTPF